MQQRERTNDRETEEEGLRLRQKKGEKIRKLKSDNRAEREAGEDKKKYNNKVTYVKEKEQRLHKRADKNGKGMR